MDVEIEKKNSLWYSVLKYKYGETKVVVKGGGFAVSDLVA